MPQTEEVQLHVDDDLKEQWDKYNSLKSKQASLADFWGIKYIHVSRDKFVAKMPITDKIRQPYGRLHGGASVAFAETIASVAALFWIDIEKEGAVGLEINANHVRPVGEGYIFGTGTPIHIGKKTQVWSVDIKDERGKLVCISRCTVSIIPKDQGKPRNNSKL
ncbi:1,4-dihydroxy-2-naphthoyl-CoA hydrolase [Acrasis kona]|uniref:1,4-dihydroxy-2-naphthoyl-CoA hydrolase n=1 Tax=Acrasis kona TaxID=1008807 RepID=A0AAW2YKS5_9EUKA